MDKEPEQVLEGAKEALAGVRNVTEIKGIKAREIGQNVEVEVSLDVPRDITVSQGEKIKDEVKKALRKAFDRKSTINVRLFPVPNDV